MFVHLFACIDLCVHPHPFLISCTVENAANTAGTTEQFFLSSLTWPKPPNNHSSGSRQGWGGIGRMKILDLAGSKRRETEIP